jgi:hypothetical protein
MVLAPVNARHEKSVLAGFLGRQKLLVHTHTIGSCVRTLSDCMHNNCLLYPRFLAIKRAMPAGKPKGRPPKQSENRGRITLRLPVDAIAGVKKAAKRQRTSQADYINDAVRPVLIAQGIIKEKAK